MNEEFIRIFEKSEISLDLSSEDSITKALIEYAKFFWDAAWLEASRRADNRAREECAELALNTPRTASAAHNIGMKIRATISEK